MDRSERRLAAIMFTDVVGYTALTQTDESATIQLLKDQRRLLRPVFASHGGHEIKTMGDAFLVEFGSALDAALCAVSIQNMLRDRRVARGERLMLKIGIHVGDVVESEKDVLGDAVNIASRIEPVAEPGGICVSEQVYDQIHNKVPYRLAKLGRQELKNVAEPIDIYKVVLPWDEEALGKSTTRTLDRKRVAILPLVSLSPDPNDEYFADGTTEEMISTLSNISNLTVISRTSIMQYKGARKNLADIGRELNAGTLLEGSVRKSGNRVRITVQLLDALEDKHLWAQSYDRDLEDVFAVQTDVAKSVAEALRVKLNANEASQIRKRPTESPEAHLLYLMGRQQWNKRSEASIKEAIESFSRAVKLDSNFALAHVGLADCYMVLYDQNLMNLAESTEKSQSALLKALQLDETLAEAHSSYGLFLMHKWNWDGAEVEFKKAIQLNPNFATAHQWFGVLRRNEGRLEEALVEAKKGLELDPLAPVMSGNVGWWLVDSDRPDDAIEYFQRSLEVEPNFIPSLQGMTVAYVSKGDYDNAMIWWEKTARVDQHEAWNLLNLALLRAEAGDKDGALESLGDAMNLQDSRKLPPSQIALLFAFLHDEERALEYSEKALEAHDPGIVLIKVIPPFKEFRFRPGFMKILKKVGLDKY